MIEPPHNQTKALKYFYSIAWKVETFSLLFMAPIEGGGMEIKMDKQVNEPIIERELDEKNWGAVKEIIEDTALLQLGVYYSQMIQMDIKHLCFTLSRYKFVSKLLMYKENVNLLELGCQEAMGAIVFKQNIKLGKYLGIDLDEEAIDWNKKNLSNEFEFLCANFFDCTERLVEQFDAVVSLDVIEHISHEMEDKYCEVICSSINNRGIAVIGTPNIMLSPYASEGSKIGHINLYDQARLYELMSKYFNNVFIFNMNDEVVNTGFAPMSCYIFAVCCNKK